MSALSSIEHESINTSDSSSLLQKPRVAIFLDTDGIYNTKDSDEEIKKKVNAIFTESKTNGLSEKEIDRELDNCRFDLIAVGNLMHIINTLDKVAEVMIIVSSNHWRKGKDVKKLKTEVFVHQPFAKYIRDKIPDRLRDGKKLISTKPRLIDAWKKANQIVLNIVASVVLDDIDCHDASDPKAKMSLLFKNEFVHVNGNERLTRENADQAINLVIAKLA